MKIEIRHLMLVRAVAATGSLTKAAESLFRTQSALSHQLKEVETTLGSPLFYRVNKRMVLTPIGERLLSSAHVILDELEQAEAEIEQTINGEAGLIRIATHCYTCYHWLPKLMMQFRSLYPKVDLRITAEATRDPIHFLLDGQLDVALVNRVEDHHQLQYTPLFTDELVFVMHPQHRLRNCAYIKPEDFALENFLIYTNELEENSTYKYVLEPANVRPKEITNMSLTEAILEMVKANLGITVMAKWALTPYLNSDQLLIKPVGKKGFQRTYYAATIAQTNPPAYLNCFIKQLKALDINKMGTAEVKDAKLMV